MKLAKPGLAGFQVGPFPDSRCGREVSPWSGVVIGMVKHLEEDKHNQLLVEAMSGEALTTSEIEGKILKRASVLSSIQRQFGLVADKRHHAGGTKNCRNDG